MNRFDEKYDIRLAKYEEISEIMTFINTFWKEGHILAVDRSFFEYEHVVDRQVTFLIAKEWTSGEIHGILGYLPASSDKDRYDIWGVVWKVNDKAMPMLGIELMKRIMVCSGARTELGIGANPKTAIPLLGRILHYKTGKMKHYYSISLREEYKVAKIVHEVPITPESLKETRVERFYDMAEVKKRFDFTINREDIPYKDAWYVERRFFSHPVYVYEVYGLSEGQGSTQALLVCREQEQNGVKVLRIVDYIGNQELFGGIRRFVKEKLKVYEYIDFYCLGFDERYVLEAGFTLREENDTNIIPNYFAPFVQENVEIWVNSIKEECLYFKADGDQDRPN